jgi:hypothetical protein
MGPPGAVANGDCVRELGRLNRKDKVLERVIKYWLGLWEVDESNPIGAALRYKLKGRQNNWLDKVKKKLEQLDMGNIWRKEQRKMIERYEE